MIRRTVPAMAVTAVVFAVVQFAVPPLVRAHLDPVVQTTTVTPENLRGLFMMSGAGGPVVELEIQTDTPGAWMIGNETLDRRRQVPSTCCRPGSATACARTADADGPLADPVCFKRFADDGYRQRITYQPADRYWTLQAVEMAASSRSPAACSRSASSGSPPDRVSDAGVVEHEPGRVEDQHALEVSGDQ